MVVSLTNTIKDQMIKNEEMTLHEIYEKVEKELEEYNYESKELRHAIRGVLSYLKRNNMIKQTNIATYMKTIYE